MCRSMVDIQSATAEIRRGIKKIEDRRKKPQGKNIMSASATQGGHDKNSVTAGMADRIVATAEYGLSRTADLHGGHPFRERIQTHHIQPVHIPVLRGNSQHHNPTRSVFWRLTIIHVKHKTDRHTTNRINKPNRYHCRLKMTGQTKMTPLIEAYSQSK